MKGTDVYPILLDLLANPGSPQAYRQLKRYYESAGMNNEAEAVGYLLENKFGENATNTDNTGSNQKQLSSDKGN